MNEGICTIELGSKKYSALGAVVTPNYAICYINETTKRVETWHGSTLGIYKIISEWKQPTRYDWYTMRAVQIVINKLTYHGRYNSDWSQLVRAYRYKDQL